MPLTERLYMSNEEEANEVLLTERLYMSNEKPAKRSVARSD